MPWIGTARAGCDRERSAVAVKAMSSGTRRRKSGELASTATRNIGSVGAMLWSTSGSVVASSGADARRKDAAGEREAVRSRAMSPSAWSMSRRGWDWNLGDVDGCRSRGADRRTETARRRSGARERHRDRRVVAGAATANASASVMTAVVILMAQRLERAQEVAAEDLRTRSGDSHAPACARTRSAARAGGHVARRDDGAVQSLPSAA